MHDLVNDINTFEWKIRSNKLDFIFHKPIIFETIKTKRLQWAGHTCYNVTTYGIGKESNRKDTFRRRTSNKMGRPVKDVKIVKKDVEELGKESDWKERANDRDC